MSALFKMDCICPACGTGHLPQPKAGICRRCDTPLPDEPAPGPRSSTVVGHDPAGDRMVEATITFKPLDGGPSRQLKTLMPPQDGGQAIEP